MLFTEKELVKMIKVSRGTLNKYRKLGLPCVKVGERLVRYDYEAALLWLKNYNGREVGVLN